MKIFRLIFILLVVSAGVYSEDIIRSEEENFRITAVIGDLEYPWSLAFLPGQEGILLTERTGKLSILKDGNLTQISGLPSIAVTGQGGLLDVITDNDFQHNRLIYFSFSEPGRGGYGTAVARAELKGSELQNLKIIFSAESKSRSGIHFGSRLLMTADDYLYITLGERGEMDNAQNLGHHGGSVVRINPDGSVPEDNPFAGRADALPEIFSYGHRNPQGLAYNPETKEIWLHEHGPKGGDEVNIIRRGANYGWPVITYGINYNGTIITKDTAKQGMEQPVTYWVPSIAPSGMTFYYGNMFPRWQGNLFVGALAGEHLRRIVPDGNQVVHEEILLKNEIGRIRDVRTGPDGALYILTDDKRGVLYKIEAAP